MDESSKIWGEPLRFCSINFGAIPKNWRKEIIPLIFNANDMPPYTPRWTEGQKSSEEWGEKYRQQNKKTCHPLWGKRLKLLRSENSTQNATACKGWLIKKRNGWTNVKLHMARKMKKVRVRHNAVIILSAGHMWYRGVLTQVRADPDLKDEDKCQQNQKQSLSQPSQKSSRWECCAACSKERNLYPMLELKRGHS